MVDEDFGNTSGQLTTISPSGSPVAYGGNPQDRAASPFAPRRKPPLRVQQFAQVGEPAHRNCFTRPHYLTTATVSQDRNGSQLAIGNEHAIPCHLCRERA